MNDMRLMDRMKRLGASALIMLGTSEVSKDLSTAAVHTNNSLETKTRSLIMDVASPVISSADIQGSLIKSKTELEVFVYQFGNDVGDDVMSAYNKAIAILGHEKLHAESTDLAVSQINAIADLSEKIRPLGEKAKGNLKDIIIKNLGIFAALTFLLATSRPKRSE